MKKVMTLSLAVILLVGTCVVIGLRTVKSDGYYDYGDDDEAAAEYYATYNFEDDYTTKAGKLFRNDSVSSTDKSIYQPCRIAGCCNC